jgi:hypothetical protein
MRLLGMVLYLLAYMQVRWRTEPNISSGAVVMF